MSKPRELILTVKNIEALRNIHWDKDGVDGFTLSVMSGKIHSVNIISGRVLSIVFDSGKLLIDIQKDDLKDIKNEE
ncbi:MAG: hypothetical protein ACFFD4_13480 [Candidatus Odinarchaeota archaeon]